jgi:hypothetical protein
VVKRANWWQNDTLMSKSAVAKKKVKFVASGSVANASACRAKYSYVKV